MGQVDLLLVVYLLTPITLGLIVIEIGKLRFSRAVTFVAATGIISLYLILVWPIWAETLRIRTVCYPLLFLGIIWFFVDDTPRRKLFFFVAYYLVSLAADMSCSVFGIMFLDISMDQLVLPVASPARLLGSAISPVFMMSYSSIFVAFYNKIEAAVRWRIVLLMILLLISQCMFTVGMSWQSSELITDRIILYACLCELVCVFVQYAMYATINTSAAAVKDRMELENLRLKREMDHKYIEMAQENARQMAVLRHDFKNQLQIAYALLDQQPEKAAAFMGEMEQKLEAIRPVRYCPNPIVNTILTIKAADAAQAGIEFTAEAAVNGWKLEETDLSSLFLNLLDNAIEGCQRSGKDHASIHLKAGKLAGCYVVRVTNDCADDLRPEDGFATTKRDSQRHGLGLNILRSIAKKYDGKMTMDVKNGSFEAQVVLTEPGEDGGAASGAC